MPTNLLLSIRENTSPAQGPHDDGAHAFVNWLTTVKIRKQSQEERALMTRRMAQWRRVDRMHPRGRKALGGNSRPQWYQVWLFDAYASGPKLLLSDTVAL